MLKYFCCATWPEGHEREFEREDDYDVISTRKADIRKFAKQALKDGAIEVDVYFESTGGDFRAAGYVTTFDQDNPKGTDVRGRNF